MKILDLEQIKETLPSIDLMDEIGAGFVAYSEGRAVVPPVGELILDSPPGDVHIKYGYLKGDDYYVIKIASGFYENEKVNLPSSNGMMLLFSQRTGEAAGILLDQGYLTDIRTAVAGAIAARHLAPKKVTCIGIVGTGMQARLQLKHLSTVTDCREVLVWGRDAGKVRSYQDEMSAHGFSVSAAIEPDKLMTSCNLIVTTTPSTVALLRPPAEGITGVHITAMGSDTAGKQELDTEILKKADLVVADSLSQCRTRGEIHHSLADGVLNEEDVMELGDIVSGRHPGRTTDDQVTVADLTGVAVQDMQIAKAVLAASSSN